mmetsp:Transcript_2105/g.4568  ORF Transcript_2105/g.4568 Transcript_2105/m.4568 type:complete len:223 (+) Transcript_2105:256-924(+)
MATGPFGVLPGIHFPRGNNEAQNNPGSTRFFYVIFFVFLFTTASLLFCLVSEITRKVQDDWIPLDFHGRGRDFEAGPSSWDVSKNEMGPSGYPERYFNDARKFDSGGKAHPLLLPMLRAAMEEIVSIDVVKAQEQLKVLTQPLLDWAVGNGYSLKDGPRAYHLIGIVPNEKTPEEMIVVAKRLAAEKGVILAVRCGGFRVSSYLTNTENDVTKLIQGLNGLS